MSGETASDIGGAIQRGALPVLINCIIFIGCRCADGLPDKTQANASIKVSLLISSIQTKKSPWPQIEHTATKFLLHI